MMKCERCGRELANTSYTLMYGNRTETVCPICWLGIEEGSQSKYWETSKEPKPEGFRYADDTHSYDDHWDADIKKWVKNEPEQETV